MAFRRPLQRSYNCIKARVRRANEAAGYSCGDELHAIWFLFSFGGIAICVKPPPPTSEVDGGTDEWGCAHRPVYIVLDYQNTHAATARVA